MSCKDIDNIYIATINNTHHDLIIKCLEAKKNVLCEKPFVIDYEQAKNIKNKVEESKMLFLEALAYRSHPQIKKVISLINANSIGKILKINSSYGINKGKPKKAKEQQEKEKWGIIEKTQEKPWTKHGNARENIWTTKGNRSNK